MSWSLVGEVLTATLQRQLTKATWFASHWTGNNDGHISVSRTSSHEWTVNWSMKKGKIAPCCGSWGNKKVHLQAGGRQFHSVWGVSRSRCKHTHTHIHTTQTLFASLTRQMKRNVVIIAQLFYDKTLDMTFACTSAVAAARASLKLGEKLEENLIKWENSSSH